MGIEDCRYQARVPCRPVTAKNLRRESTDANTLLSLAVRRRKVASRLSRFFQVRYPTRPDLPPTRGGLPGEQPGGVINEQPRGPAGPEEDASKPPTELEALEVCDRQFTSPRYLNHLSVS